MQQSYVTAASSIFSQIEKKMQLAVFFHAAVIHNIPAPSTFSDLRILTNDSITFNKVLLITAPQ